MEKEMRWLIQDMFNQYRDESSRKYWGCHSSFKLDSWILYSEVQDMELFQLSLEAVSYTRESCFSVVPGMPTEWPETAKSHSFFACETGILSFCGVIATVNKEMMILCMQNQFSHVWLCDPVDSSRPGSSAPGISQAGILEWVVIPFATGSSWPKNRTWVSWVAGRFFIKWVTREARGQ